MSFYWHLNESTGKLVYSNSPTYDDGSGDTWLPLEQTNTNPIMKADWAFDSYRQSIALVEWDKANGKIVELTKMRYMFSGCTSLVSPDLSGFDTSKATNMDGMFSDCTSLVSLDLSGFDTSRVAYMSSMFQNCSSLASLDLSGFDTSLVTDMRYVFRNCSSLASLDLSGFDTSKVTTKGSMFYGCAGLRILAVSGSMSNVLPELPKAQYYPAAGGDAVAKADLTAGTWIKDAGDLSVCTSLVDLAQARIALSRSVTKLAKRIAKMK